MTIKLVTFDALHTLITPRRPIYVQYSEVFAPFLGVLSPTALQRSFKATLRQMQQDKPAYQGQSGAQGWWSEVIKGTAIGAGADAQAVEASLNRIVPKLLDRFSSREGYKLFDDTLPVLRQLREMNVSTALVSNADARMRLVLTDLEISPFFQPLLLSEEVGVEKPHAEIFQRALKYAALDITTTPNQGVHVGDELRCDYHGAQAAGMQALLMRRPGPDGDGENKEAEEDLRNVEVVPSLWGVLECVREQNADSSVNWGEGYYAKVRSDP
ncbi:HAD-like domain-containing protein [Melanogaster broomeanus]|nr:HAD-like domain-containing protein [Melanogaster broomeanus]